MYNSTASEAIWLDGDALGSLPHAGEKGGFEMVSEGDSDDLHSYRSISAFRHGYYVKRY